MHDRRLRRRRWRRRQRRRFSTEAGAFRIHLRRIQGKHRKGPRKSKRPPGKRVWDSATAVANAAKAVHAHAVAADFSFKVDPQLQRYLRYSRNTRYIFNSYHNIMKLNDLKLFFLYYRSNIFHKIWFGFSDIKCMSCMHPLHSLHLCIPEKHLLFSQSPFLLSFALKQPVWLTRREKALLLSLLRTPSNYVHQEEEEEKKISFPLLHVVLEERKKSWGPLYVRTFLKF